MSETKNYKLHLTDSDTERFQDWREAMNGTEDSNMLKIDNALGEKADKSSPFHAVLLPNVWVGDKAPFTQELSIDGMTVERNGVISVAQDATKKQREIARYAMLAVVGQEDGKLTIAADGEKPEQEIPVEIIFLG